MKFPKKIKVIEVGPRDGLQSLNKWIPTQDKIKMVNLLSSANFPVIEVSSFAHPKVVPMLKDVENLRHVYSARAGRLHTENGVPAISGAHRWWRGGSGRAASSTHRSSSTVPSPQLSRSSSTSQVELRFYALIDASTCYTELTMTRAVHRLPDAA